MRLNFKNLLVLSLFAFLTVFSCQDEVFEETQNQEQTLEPNSSVVNLMQATTSNDGAVDNLLDNTDCFSIELPVTIIANGITITISSLEDLELLEDIFDEFEDDEDSLEFLFPITIVLNDYTEIVIEDEESLEEFIDQCTEADDDEDIIECVDFVYPISFSVFNIDFDLIDTVTVNSDEELYDFLDDLEDSENAVIASLNYPVSLVYADGNTVTVNSNTELEAAINEAQEECDDDYDDECEIDDLDAYLQTCHWELDEFAGVDVELDIDFYFEASGTVIVQNEDTAEVAEGNWNTSETDEGIVLVLDGLDGFAGDFNGEWLLTDCEDYEFEFVSNTGNAAVTMTLEKECDDSSDCEPQEIFAELLECQWYSGSNLLDNFNGPFVFGEDDVLYLNENGNLTPIGTWFLQATNEDLTLVFNINEDPYNAYNGAWELFECDDYYFKVISGDNYIIFEQDCENDVDDSVFDCFDEEGYVLEECDEDGDGFAQFNLYEVEDLATCLDGSVTTTVSFHETLAGAESDTDFISDATSYTNVVNPQTVYIKVALFDNPEEYEIYPVDLVVDDCSGGDCNELAIDDYLQTCVWYVVNYNGDDNLIDFEFDFISSTEVVITGAGQTITAMWSTSSSADGTIVTFDGINLPDVQAISGAWIVVECTPSLLQLESANSTNQNFMILEQDCE